MHAESPDSELTIQKIQTWNICVEWSEYLCELTTQTGYRSLTFACWVKWVWTDSRDTKDKLDVWFVEGDYYFCEFTTQI